MFRLLRREIQILRNVNMASFHLQSQFYERAYFTFQITLISLVDSIQQGMLTNHYTGNTHCCCMMPIDEKKSQKFLVFQEPSWVEASQNVRAVFKRNYTKHAISKLRLAYYARAILNLHLSRIYNYFAQQKLRTRLHYVKHNHHSLY